MGIFRRHGQRPKGTSEGNNALFLEGDELVNAVGESYYQPALLAACGARPGAVVAFDCIAALVAEPDNRHDPNAVMVQVDGRQVAHLSREDAVAYGPAVRSASKRGYVVACDARIAGRGEEGETANLGIFLKLPKPDDALGMLSR